MEEVVEFLRQARVGLVAGFSAVLGGAAPPAAAPPETAETAAPARTADWSGFVASLGPNQQKLLRVLAAHPDGLDIAVITKETRLQSNNATTGVIVGLGNKVRGFGLVKKDVVDRDKNRTFYRPGRLLLGDESFAKG